MELPPQALSEAMARLQGGGAPSEGAAGGRRLLAWLGWEAPVEESRRLDRIALLRVALLCRPVFGLVLPSRPGLCAIGARLDLESAIGEAGLPVLGASGVGLTPGRAFAACMGEAAERLAQVERPEDRDGGDMVALCSWQGEPAGDWPRDLVFRRAAARRTLQPAAPLSIGCAAGPCWPSARRAALLEVIERDAVALWWRGGIPATRLAADHPAARAATALLREGGGVPAAGAEMLLDLTTDLGVPTVAAIAFDGSGSGFLCGTAAGPLLEEAARAAVMERLQNELAVALAAAKRQEFGASALGPRDRAHLLRHATVTAEALPIIAAAAAPRGPAPPGPDFAAIAGRLQARGHAVLVHDHRRAVPGIPVSRVLATGLACEPSTDLPPRLAAAIARTGGGPGHRMRVSLFA
ncbi:YcaO-like family protein [Falsiroseomonas selenitidurans]|uniref:YcaO-like family protein n=1 Tax=Falsiroseomonas selenitidurans TaxID=2716335 RepID=A0ABX1E6N9_9PROT|nr:YcaO-like family protein [Falsiroseomonas selenitidurans]NKC31192.1 YcaO-like family protein [Falsiroseomonas selenitidurans]